MHAKRVCKDFEIKNLGEYHHLYLKSDTLLLDNVFKNFRNMCLKIDMNAKLKLKAKNNFGKYLFKLMDNAVFRKTMENMRKNRNIKLLTTERRRNYLVSEPNYLTKKIPTENLLAIEMRKTQILMNKLVYLGLSILDLSKTVMYESWYDHAKPKYGENVKHCYLDTDSFIGPVKTADIYKDISEDIETRFHTSNIELDRPLPKGKK